MKPLAYYKMVFLMMIRTSSVSFDDVTLTGSGSGWRWKRRDKVKFCLIHTAARWSTAQLKKTQAEQAAKPKAAADPGESKGKQGALTQR